MSHVGAWGSVPGRGCSQCKGTGLEVCLKCARNSKKASVTTVVCGVTRGEWRGRGERGTAGRVRALKAIGFLSFLFLNWRGFIRIIQRNGTSRRCIHRYMCICLDVCVYIWCGGERLIDCKTVTFIQKLGYAVVKKCCSLPSARPEKPMDKFSLSQKA